MIEVRVKDSDLRRASQEGMDAFVAVFADAILESVGGELNADNMSTLNSDQITLVAYVILRDELMNGGFVQLIHNGYGDFIYCNPFDKAVREWGMTELYRIIRKTHCLYSKWHEAIEQDCTQEEFDALYEQHPEFDVYDDAFVELEEDFTAQVAHYVDGNIENFAIVEHE